LAKTVGVCEDATKLTLDGLPTRFDGGNVEQCLLLSLRPENDF
jgi:hypothetical protein